MIPESYKNLTQIAITFNVHLPNWIDRPVGKNAIAQFKLQHPDIAEPIITVRGRGKAQGTYAHPELAAIFAAWCNPQFTAHVVAENTALKAAMAKLIGANKGNCYQLAGEGTNTTKPNADGLDTRFEYILQRGLTPERLAQLKPVPFKEGVIKVGSKMIYPYCCQGIHAKAISLEFDLKYVPADQYRIARCPIGSLISAKEGLKENKSDRVIKTPFGKMTVKDFGLFMVDYGYALFWW